MISLKTFKTNKWNTINSTETKWPNVMKKKLSELKKSLMETMLLLDLPLTNSDVKDLKLKLNLIYLPLNNISKKSTLPLLNLKLEDKNKKLPSKT